MAGVQARGESCGSPEEGLLAGVRVVELGHRLAGSIVGMLLAEQGAEVIRVEDARDPAADPVQDAVLSRGKTIARVDLGDAAELERLRRLLAQADVLVDDRPKGELRAMGLDAAAIRRETNPGLVISSLPAFSATDARAGVPDYEAVVGTAGYLYEKPLGKPRYHDFPVGSVIGALFATSGVVAALLARLRNGGRGQDVDVTRLGADLLAQVVLILMKTGIPRGFLPLKMVGTPFMGSWLCKDGRYIYLHITLPDHAAQILDRLEELGFRSEVAALREVLSDETMRDPSQVKSIPEAKRIRKHYEAIFLKKSADDWEEALGKDLCCIKARTVDEWISDSIGAGMSDACEVGDPIFGQLYCPGPAVSSPEHPPLLRGRVIEKAAAGAMLERWEADPRPSEAQGAHGDGDGRPPLDGVKVLDLSRIIAGPCAARVLAELGADVLSIQSPTSLDWALSFHLMFNAGKRSVTLDFTTEEGKERLWAIMEDFGPDAFIQNYRHLDIARAAGVDPESLRKRFPDLVYTHLNAYGNEGVWRDRPGFEQVVQAVSGIQMSYGTGGKPRLLPTPVIDIGSGLSGALAAVLGLYHQAKTGHGVFTATHLTRTAVLLQSKRVADFQRERCLAAAAEADVKLAHDPGRAVIAGMVSVWDGTACIAGPRRDVEQWLRHIGALGAGAAPSDDPIAAVARRLRFRPASHWQRTAEEAGVGETVVVMLAPKMRKMLEELGQFDPSAAPPVFKRPYPGSPAELTFVRNPIVLSLNPVVQVDPPPVRGENTREVLGNVGFTVPEGAGVVPYPPNKPFFKWLSGVIRWGYFAWRSGNI